MSTPDEYTPGGSIGAPFERPYEYGQAYKSGSTLVMVLGLNFWSFGSYCFPWDIQAIAAEAPPQHRGAIPTRQMQMSSTASEASEAP